MEGEKSKIKKLASVKHLNLNMSDPMNVNLPSIFIAFFMLPAHDDIVYTKFQFRLVIVVQVYYIGTYLMLPVLDFCSMFGRSCIFDHLFNYHCEQ